MESFRKAGELLGLRQFYREDSKEERSNYRPIFVLPVLARFFENLENKQLYDYLDKNELIN